MIGPQLFELRGCNNIRMARNTNPGELCFIASDGCHSVYCMSVSKMVDQMPVSRLVYTSPHSSRLRSLLVPVGFFSVAVVCFVSVLFWLSWVFREQVRQCVGNEVLSPDEPEMKVWSSLYSACPTVAVKLRGRHFERVPSLEQMLAAVMLPYSLPGVRAVQDGAGWSDEQLAGKAEAWGLPNVHSLKDTLAAGRRPSATVGSNEPAAEAFASAQSLQLQLLLLDCMATKPGEEVVKVQSCVLDFRN